VYKSIDGKRGVFGLVERKEGRKEEEENGHFGNH